MVAASAPSAEVASLAAPARPAEPSGAVTPTYEGQPAPASIGWLWPDDTAQGGGVPGWRPPRRWAVGDRWRYRTATLVALGAVLLAGAGVVIGMALHSSAAKIPSRCRRAGNIGYDRRVGRRPATRGRSTTRQVLVVPPPPAALLHRRQIRRRSPSIRVRQLRRIRRWRADRANAAAFVTGQVGSATAVACDAQACTALTNSGFGGQKVQIGKNSTSLSNAGLVVVTPEFLKLAKSNPGLRADVAPVDLASWGSGSARVTVQVVNPSGGAAYMTAFNQLIQTRKQVGQQLASSGRVSASPAAKSDLTSGEVDQRLMLVIKAMANLEKVAVVGFTRSGPGASAGVPFRGMVLAEHDPAATVAAQAYLQAMLQLLQAHAKFPGLNFSHKVTLPNGQPGIEVGYYAPTPIKG